jgi:hypothetical protein
MMFNRHMDTNPTVEKILTKDSDPVWITGGAIEQDGSRQLHRCGECGGDVVWVKSHRTGRHYLADVSQGYNGQRFYMKSSPHFKSCGERVSSLDAHIEAEETLAESAAKSRRVDDARKALDRGEINVAAFLAIVETEYSAA